MPYQLGGRNLPFDVPWEHENIQYPANWLRLSSAQDRAELGITWVDDSLTWNQKWYWGYDSDGNLIPKAYASLKALYVANTKEIANKLLQPSDWRVIKAKERGSTMNANWKTWRQTIRTECGTMITAIEATADVGDTSPHVDFGRVQALQEYIEGSSYNVWTADPDQPVVEEVDDTVDIGDAADVVSGGEA